MQLTGGNTLPNIGRRINWQLVTLVGGLAIAISAGVLAGAFDRSSSPETAVVAAAAEPPAPRLNDTAVVQSTPSEVVYVVTGSQAEANALESAISTAAASMPELAILTGVMDVVALETPEQEAQFATMMQFSTPELMSANIGVRVVDIREAAAPTTPVVYVVGTEAERELLERTSVHEENVSIFVLERGLLEDDALYNTIVGEQMAGANFELVDLRR